MISLWSGCPLSMMDFSISVEVGQACTQAPQDTHSDSRKSVGPAAITEAKPRPSTVSAKVPCTSSQARTQREHTMHLVGIEGEVGVGRVLLGAQVIGAVIAVAHLAQPHHACHLLQLAVPVGRARETVQRMVGDVQLHDAAAQVRQLARLRAHFHAGLHQSGAGGGVALAALDLHQAQPAGAKRLEHVGGAQLGHAHSGLRRGTHHRGSCGDRDGHAVDLEADQLARHAPRRAGVELFH